MKCLMQKMQENCRSPYDCPEKLLKFILDQSNAVGTRDKITPCYGLYDNSTRIGGSKDLKMDIEKRSPIAELILDLLKSQLEPWLTKKGMNIEQFEKLLILWDNKCYPDATVPKNDFKKLNECYFKHRSEGTDTMLVLAVMVNCTGTFALNAHPDYPDIFVLSASAYITMTTRILTHHLNTDSQIGIIETIIDGSLVSRKRNYDEFSIKTSVELDIAMLKPASIVYDKLKERYVFIVDSSPLRGIVYDANKTLPQNDPVSINPSHLLCDTSKNIIHAFIAV